MNLDQTVKISGHLKIEIFNSEGRLKDVRDISNLVVNVGKNYIASRMVGVASNIMSHMAVGSGAVAAVVGDTTLGTELARAVLTGQSASSNTVSYTAIFGAGVGTGTLAEAGIFNSGAGGTMICRTVFPVVNKAALDTINITWVITIT